MKEPAQHRNEQRAGFAGMVTVTASGFFIAPDWAWGVALVLFVIVAVWLFVEVRARSARR